MKNFAFNSVFAAVLALTISSGGTAVYFANQPTLTQSQDRILDSAIATWTMSTTTLIGLLGNWPDNDSNDEA